MDHSIKYLETNIYIRQLEIFVSSIKLTTYIETAVSNTSCHFRNKCPYPPYRKICWFTDFPAF